MMMMMKGVSMIPIVMVIMIMIVMLLYIRMYDSNRTIVDSVINHSRRLQFEQMFEFPGLSGAKGRRKKGGGKEGGGGGGGGGRGRVSRPVALSNTVDEIILNMDRYNLWWTGPPDTDTFKPVEWGSSHVDSNHAIFTMAVVQGQAHGDIRICSSPNDFKLYLGTARKYFNGDIVIAVDAGLSDEVKNVLIQYKAVVYELPHNLCAKETKSAFCGSGPSSSY